jgi:transposase
MRSKVYPSDLTDRQWAVVAPLLPPPAPRGRRRSVDLRAILDGILYVLGTGCSWRSLPRDLPKWITVYAYFRRWQRDGTWARLHDALRRRERVRRGRAATPGAGSLDSQSVKTTERGGRAATTAASACRGASATC